MKTFLTYASSHKVMSHDMPLFQALSQEAHRQKVMPRICWLDEVHEYVGSFIYYG